MGKPRHPVKSITARFACLPLGAFLATLAGCSDPNLPDLPLKLTLREAALEQGYV